MASFERSLRHPAVRVLQEDTCGGPPGVPAALDADGCSMLAYMLGSGTYGTLANRTANRLRALAGEGRGHARARYLLERAFPRPVLLRQGYPVLARHPCLLPAVYAYRLTVKPFLRIGRLKAELGALARFDRGGGRGE